ncbi:MAG TPA: heme o synthase [Chthoniobacteraceae bacterium]|nr:heme o synthase [Chthoniobacteraceae bacterium]
MNESTPIASTAISAECAIRTEGVGWIADFLLLTKARLSMLVVVTTFVGFVMAGGMALPWPVMFYTLIGTGLVAGAAGALNQVIEVHVDRLMGRTRGRPLPSGRMTRMTGFFLGCSMAALGLTILAETTTLVAAYLAAATLLIYLAFYTPMKRRTSLCVTVGAISGAIPPVIGWTAANGSLGLGAWVLFGILFAWQMPHFLALAWVYREQYSQAGFVMLTRSDTRGLWAAFQSLLYTFALAAITFIPYFAGKAGLGYLIGAIVCNLPMVLCAILFMKSRSVRSARTLFIASILYLPVQLGLMMLLIKG